MAIQKGSAVASRRAWGVPSLVRAAAIGARTGPLHGIWDHCYVLNKEPGRDLSLAARVAEPTSGRVLEVYTTQPGVQFYTGNPRAFCLETQHYPDAPNKPSFPSTLLRPGQKYSETTVYKFSVLGQITNSK